MALTVSSCTTALNQGKDALQDGVDVPGIGKVGLIQERPNAGADVELRAELRAEIQNVREVTSDLREVAINLEEASRSVKLDAENKALAEKLGAAASTHRVALAEITAELDKVYAMLYAIVRAEGIEALLAAVTDAKEYLESLTPEPQGDTQ